MRPIIREGRTADKEWISSLITQRWGDTRIVARGRIYEATLLPALVALIREIPSGVLTYSIEEGKCQIVTLDAHIPGKGVGTALVDELCRRMKEEGIDRVWLVTSNDNRPAQAFYQHRGFRLAAIHAGAIEEARKLKPSIPLTGHAAIPIVDELEYERTL